MPQVDTLATSEKSEIFVQRSWAGVFTYYTLSAVVPNSRGQSNCQDHCQRVPPMTDTLELIYDEMRQCNSLGDPEAGHVHADELLLRLVRYLTTVGSRSTFVERILDEYKRVEKWYS